MNSAPASWFKLPAGAQVRANQDTPVQFTLRVPKTAAPGMYASTIIVKIRLSTGATQNLRIPVQLFVPIATPASGASTSIEGPIWAYDVTDYSAIGFENPEADIYTDWAMFPLRVTDPNTVDLSVYDTAGNDHMDVFVFDDNGQEVDSTVTPFLSHAVPLGGLYATTADDPATVSLLDGSDLIDVALPTTLWIAVSDSGPDQVGFSTFHLDLDVQTGGGGTPPERIHSGQRAYALVSTDGGATWTSLATAADGDSGTTTADPIGDSGGILGGSKAFENGLTGASGSPPFTAPVQTPVLTEHTADISPYAGQTIQLRFADTSDSGTNLEGFYVDDLSILDGSGVVLSTDDMETQGTWVSDGTPGFARVTASSSP